MKHFSFVLSILTCLAVILLAAAPTTVMAAPFNPVVKTGKVITVYPTGSDDTANLQKAFNMAKKAGKGSTVQLAVGQFRTRIIVVEDFDGYFKGMGQKKTFIDTFPNQDCQTIIDKGILPGVVNSFAATHACRT